uniref:Zinc finger, SWIM-type containing 7 n=1 Tax=Xiphophorus maculatus TaxID=8083 RepID=A0A3B5R9Y4_XIPMA
MKSGSARSKKLCGKMRTFLPAVAEQLFGDIQKNYEETTQIPDDLLIALKFVFGTCALQALDLVDQRSVTCLSSPSGRKAFQVTGGSGRLYTCFLSCHYCPCPAFTYTVLRRNQGLLNTKKKQPGVGVEQKSMEVNREWFWSLSPRAAQRWKQISGKHRMSSGTVLSSALSEFTAVS